jgi:head-tail adaptor
MYFSDIITLRAVTYGTDDYGGEKKTYTDTTVYADKKSITRSEFYASTANNIKVSIAFTVRAEDYAGQEIILSAAKTYKVLRSYQKDLSTVELVCTAMEG